MHESSTGRPSVRPLEIYNEINESVIQQLANYKQTGFLTVTLSPKLYKYSSVTQLELTNNILYKLLYKNTAHYTIVAEHTKQCNIHYHALVSFTDSGPQQIGLLNKLRSQKLFGFVKFDSSIGDNVKACNYLTKDIYDTIEVFKSVKPRNPQYYMTWNYYRNNYDI